MDVQTERWNLDFATAKSIRYHAYRRSFWDMCDNASKVFTIISGASVIVAIVGEHTSAATVLAVIVALTSASDVVLGFSQKARNHDGLYRAFSRLAQDIAEGENPTEENISAWRRRRLEIEMDEPFILDLLERRCSAEECMARGCELQSAWRLTKWQTRFSQISFWPAAYRDEATKEC